MNKTVAHRNSRYLDFIRSRPCCVTGERQGARGLGVVAAHVRRMGSGGMGLKPSDYHTVPLLWEVHEKQHNLGEDEFWKSEGICPEQVIARNLWSYMQAHLTPKEAMIDSLIGAIESVRRKSRK